MKARQLLVDLVRVPIGPLLRRPLEVIDGWNFDREAAKAMHDLRELGHDPDDAFIERGIWALRKYHAIAVLDPLNGHAISDVLDPFWHAQILFTEPYALFCDKVLGQFMHHYPLDHTDKEAVDLVRRLYDYTVEVHQAIFKDADLEFYPINMPEPRLVCLHLKSRRDHPYAAETTFAERPDLVSA